MAERQRFANPSSFQSPSFLLACSHFGKRQIHDARLNLPDGVVRPQANPLGNGTVLLLSFGKLLLGAEGLLALFSSKKNFSKQNIHLHLKLTSSK